MPLEPEIPFMVAPITVMAGLLALVYSCFGALMWLLAGGSLSFVVRDLVGDAFVLLPLLAFPIFLSSIHSMKMCRDLLSAYFIVDLVVGLIAEGSNFRFGYFVSIPRCAIALSVILINIVYFLIRRAYQGNEKGIPGLVEIVRDN